MSFLDDLKKIKSGKKEIREFAFLVGGILVVLGGWSLWREKPFYLWLLGIGGALILAGWIIPKMLKPVHKLWMGLSICLGFIVSRIILTVLFYLILSPIAVMGRLFGKKFINTEFRTQEASYWIPKKDSLHTPSFYENQF